MAPANSVSVVVTASHGCCHAQAVLEALRSQMCAEDQLLVIEPGNCRAAGEVPRLAREEHIEGSSDDFESRTEGVRRATQSIVVVLEDHGVPNPGFIAALRQYFAGVHGPAATTFWMVNGTGEDAASRALFSYVTAGVNDSGSSSSAARPPMVASSFAVAGATSVRLRGSAVAGSLRPGQIEYEVLPAILAAETRPLPRELTLVHHQRNTVREATSATYWNARFAGWAERQTALPRGNVQHTLRRYLGRSVVLARHPGRALDERAVLAAIGLSGLAGWWVGRYRGPGVSAEKLRDAHPVPAW